MPLGLQVEATPTPSEQFISHNLAENIGDDVTLEG